MQKEMIFHDGIFKLAEIMSDEIVISNVQDALDLLGDASYNDSNKIILHEKNFIPEFFKLSTGLAGEILQKCVNYHVKLAIIGEFEKYNSNSLKAFILECNRGSQFYFVKDLDEAKKKLGNN